MKNSPLDPNNLLAIAVQNGNTAVAEFLIQHGADINLHGPKTSASITPPFQASAKNEQQQEPPPAVQPVVAYSAATTRAIVAPERAVFNKKTTPVIR